jgi:hypothetical protein
VVPDVLLPDQLRDKWVDDDLHRLSGLWGALVGPGLVGVPVVAPVCRLPAQRLEIL